jgi:mono/diheme cytochrome c family protein
MEPFNWMVHQFKMKGQQESTFFGDGFGMRQPVGGTVSRGNLPYLYANNQAEASVNMINSLLPSKSNLEKGQKKYNTFCSPCHGYFGKGDSRLRGQFPAPPSLQSEKVRNWKDGDIFHVITSGQNVMPSYASQLTAEERWQVILYVRALQRSQNARETDLQ